MIQYRLTRLTPSAGEMLELASVAGARFDLRVLEEAAESRLAAPLEEAVGSGMIEELPGPQISYRFSHELVRRALYDRLARARCAELHRRYGDALERVHAGNTDRVASELAHHFAVAAPLGESERAVRYNLRAAELAMGAFGFEEAAARLSTALGLGMAGGSDRGRAELELSRALWITGKQERAVEVLEDARETARAV